MLFYLKFLKTEKKGERVREIKEGGGGGGGGRRGGGRRFLLNTFEFAVVLIKCYLIV